MRFIRFNPRLILILAVAVLLFAAQDSLARNVLLPDDDGKSDSESAPNLGLIPAPQTPAPATPSAPVAAPKATPAAQSPMPKAPAMQNVDPAVLEGLSDKDKALFNVVKDKIEKGEFDTYIKNNTTVTPPPSKVDITPGGVIEKQYTADQIATAKLLSKGIVPSKMISTRKEDQAKRLQAAYMKKFDRPPSILDDTEVANFDDPMANFKIDVKIDGRYLWGKKDLALLKKAFDYEPQVVPTVCQLRADAKLHSDADNAYGARIFSGKQATLKYDGVLKSVNFTFHAVCIPPKALPPHGSIIMKTGDKLSVMLSNAGKCEVPPKTKPAALAIQYIGNGTTGCAYN